VVSHSISWGNGAGGSGKYYGAPGFGSSYWQATNVPHMVSIDVDEYSSQPTPSEDKVYWRGGDVLPWGLFPAASPSSIVQVPCLDNRAARGGCHLLTGYELATLWDAPDGFRDWARPTGTKSVLALLASSTPRKILTYRGDFLYTSCIRGGGLLQK